MKAALLAGISELAVKLPVIVKYEFSIFQDETEHFVVKKNEWIDKKNGKKNVFSYERKGTMKNEIKEISKFNEQIRKKEKKNTK